MAEHADLLTIHARLLTTWGEGIGYVAGGSVAVQGARIAAGPVHKGMALLAVMAAGNLQSACAGGPERERAVANRRKGENHEPQGQSTGCSAP